MQQVFLALFLIAVLATNGCATEKQSERPAALVDPRDTLQSTRASAPSVRAAEQRRPTTTLQKPAAQKVTYTAVTVPGPYLALTFDDGPEPELTPRLLDILKDRGVKATFFVLGQCVLNHPDVAKRIVAEGHEIANHSWSHPLLTRLSDNAVRSQLRRTHDIVKKTTGVTMQHMRPPYGGITNRHANWIYKEFGYKTILWSVDPKDWKDRNARLVSQRLISGAHPGGILLAHDIHASTVAAMPTTIDALLAKGFRFVTVSELLAMETKSSPTAATRTVSETPADNAAR